MRYRVLHLIFWIMKYAELAHAMLINAQLLKAGAFVGNIYVKSAVHIFFQMLVVYFSVYVLIPKLYAKEKYFRFILLLILGILAGAAGTALVIFCHSQFVNYLPQRHVSLVLTFTHVIDIGLVTAGFVTIYLVRYYYLLDKNNKLVEKERLQTELNFLKSQLNPHFLFNALNSIYVLMDEDKKQASDSLLKFSALLRYQLYECNTNETTIEKEREFIYNYILLEQVRFGENVGISFDFPADSGYLNIAPFILIPFIENAFKHISHFKEEPNTIAIKASFTDNMICFNISNTYERKELDVTHRGIGLTNVSRRLELLYPSQHTLNIVQDDKYHKVELQIKLDQQYAYKLRYN